MNPVVSALHSLPLERPLVRPDPTHAFGAALARQIPIGPLAMSAAIDLSALAFLVAGDGRALAGVAAGALHALAATGAWLAWKRQEPSRRALAVALIATLPIVGVALVALVYATAPRAELAEAPPVAAGRVVAPAPEVVQRISEALSACEVLLAAPSEQRHAALAALARHADLEAVALLRFMVSTGGERGVEAALSLDNLATSFEETLARHRAELARNPSAGEACAAAALIAQALEAGIAEPTVAPGLAAEARGYFAMADRLCGARPLEPDQAAARARLELAAMRPEGALALLDRAVTQAEPDGHSFDELRALRREAGLRAHVGGGPVLAPGDEDQDRAA